MTRFAALGDSITLGIGDPVRAASPAGGTGARGWRGWAALLATGLPEAELHNLAVNGACIASVERDQLPRALQLRPDVASVVVGVNDTLRPNFQPERIGASAAHTIGALRAAGAAVLTMRLPDPGRMLGVPGVLARPLARRAHEINLVMDEVAERFGTLHFDAASCAETYEPSMWAVDRLHPSERGHRYIARRFHAMLAASGFPVGTPPDPEPANPPPSRLAEMTWMATKGTAWVARRSTDLVPSLLAMAITEWRAGRAADPAFAGPGFAEPAFAGRDGGRGGGSRGGALPAGRRAEAVEQENLSAGQPDGEGSAAAAGLRPGDFSRPDGSEGDEPLTVGCAG